MGGYTHGMRSDRTRHPRNAGDRLDPEVAESVWDEFLEHLATLSAVAVSRIAGMPSQAAFLKKRQRDSDYDIRAAAVMASRTLNNSGRKRLTSEQWVAFLARVPTSCVLHVCREPGMPSEASVYKRRDADPEFARALAESLRKRLQLRLQGALATRERNGWRHAPRSPNNSRKGRRPTPAKTIEPPSGEMLRASLLRDGLYREIDEAIPLSLGRPARDDVAADMMVAVLSGELDRAAIRSSVKAFTREHWRLFGKFGTISLDEPGEFGEPLVERIAADRALWAS